jgi:hypothetical protein
MLVSCLAYVSILKMEAMYYSQKSVDFQHTTRYYISQEEALKCYIFHPGISVHLLSWKDDAQVFLGINLGSYLSSNDKRGWARS